MLIVDMKFGPDSTFVSLCIQRPQLLVALDFLLAVVEFFVPTVSSMLSFEEHDSSMLDAIIMDQSIYKQPYAEFSLSPQKPLIADDENFDHFIYDGDGGILYLKDAQGFNLTSASSEAIIYIGNGKKLQFRNVVIKVSVLNYIYLVFSYFVNLRFQCMLRKRIALVVFLQGGQHLDSCVYLGANSSYSALNDDNVYLEQSVESPKSTSPRGRVHEVPCQNNAVNSSTEVIFELQVKCC
jgi:vacuolar protein sorting-associated protein 13A/C